MVDQAFQGANLLDFPEKEIRFVQMLGLGSNKLFECIGEYDEVRLGFEICRRKGVQGKAMEIFKEKLLQEIDEKAFTSIVHKYTTVYTAESTNIPPALLGRPLPVLTQAGADAQSQMNDCIIGE